MTSTYLSKRLNSLSKLHYNCNLIRAAVEQNPIGRRMCRGVVGTSRGFPCSTARCCLWYLPPLILSFLGTLNDAVPSIRTTVAGSSYRAAEVMAIASSPDYSDIIHGPLSVRIDNFAVDVPACSKLLVQQASRKLFSHDPKGCFRACGAISVVVLVCSFTAGD